MDEPPEFGEWCPEDEVILTSVHPRPPQTRHKATLLRSGYTIALNFNSDAQSTHASPLYFNLTEPVRGTVGAEVVNKSHIRSISVKLTGYRVVSVFAGATSTGTSVLTQSSVTLWPSSSDGHPSAQPLGKGSYSWDFSLSLPPTVTESGHTYPLPPSFSPRGLPQYLKYKVEVFVQQKGFFVEDETVSALIYYSPRIRPGPPSELRRLAYEEGQLLPSPDEDPQGYLIFPTSQVTGKLFEKLDATLDIQLALATPTEYPRGYPLPFFLTFTSSDAQVLEILASPQSATVSLKRSHAFGHESVSKSREEYKPVEDIVGRARLWLRSEEQSTKVLQGELVPRKELLPSFETYTILLKYTLDISIQSAGFVLSKSLKQPLISVPITITSACASGPKPIPYAPAPKYGENLGDQLVTDGPKVMPW